MEYDFGKLQKLSKLKSTQTKPLTPQLTTHEIQVVNLRTALSQPQKYM